MLDNEKRRRQESAAYGHNEMPMVNNKKDKKVVQVSLPVGDELTMSLNVANSKNLVGVVFLALFLVGVVFLTLFLVEVVFLTLFLRTFKN